ncbi:MAG: hypothetical protein AAF456_11900, partial [Planctomycetota bacterium]
ADTGEANGFVDFQFDGALDLKTSSGDDHVTVTNGAAVFELFTFAGNDVVVYDSHKLFDVFTGAGDDRLISLFADTDDLHAYDGGDGFDTFEFSGVRGRAELLTISNGQFMLGFLGNAGDPRQSRFIQIEKVVAADPVANGFSNSVFISSFGGSIQRRSLVYEIDGNQATVSRPDVQPLQLENFNVFRDGGEASIFSATYPMDVTSEVTRVGFSELPIDGDTSQIMADLTVSGRRLTISDYLGEAHVVNHSSVVINQTNPDARLFTVTGLAPADVHYQGNLSSPVSDVTLIGSNSGDDVFNVSSAAGRVSMYGHGGDDIFNVGALDGDAVTDLDRLRRTVNSIGGDGIDRLNVDDSNETNDYAYRVRERWIYHIPERRSEQVRQFAGAWHSLVEAVYIGAGAGVNRFLVTPSAEVKYFIDGDAPDAGAADTLTFVGFSPQSRDYVPAGNQFVYDTFLFPGGESLPFRINNVELIDGLDRFAVGASAGSEPVVRVYDELAGNRPLFEIQAYSPGFSGGLSVATGDLNGDSVPDIVVGPKSGRSARVRIFDGVDGSVLGSFLAFDPSYTGGIDVEVGNVADSPGYEIVVGKSSGTSEYRVFRNVAENGALRFEAATTFNPFANAPGIGLNIALADFNFDGFDDVVSAASAGWRPQVAIYDVHNAVTNGNQPKQLQRFLAAPVTYSGGINVEAGNVTGNPKADLLITMTGALGGAINILAGESLPANNGNFVVSPVLSINAFNTDQHLSMTLRDRDHNGRVDAIFAGISGDTSIRRIDEYNTSGVFALVDQFWATGDPFGNGVGLG